MPKKMGINSKAAEARAKKEEKKVAEETKRQKEIDDEYWKDDDKHVNKKLQRKEERDLKRMEQLEKKKELAQLHDEDMAAAMKNLEATRSASKVTQIEIQAATAKREAAALAAAKKENAPVHEQPLEENVNRMVIEGEEARSVAEAIKALSFVDTGTDGDRHPEKRVKAAYRAFEESILPKLKAENPGMRHSQLKQLAFKMFQTYPANPKNQENH